MSAKYDTIGLNYAELRRPDPRIARIIEAALGPARSVLNVGAGTGSYEPADTVRKARGRKKSASVVRATSYE